MMVRILLATIVLTSMMTTTAAAESFDIPFVDLEAPLVDELMRELGEETNFDEPTIIRLPAVQESPDVSVDGVEMLISERALSYLPKTPPIAQEIVAEIVGAELFVYICNDTGVLSFHAGMFVEYPTWEVSATRIGATVYTPGVGGAYDSHAYCP